MRSLTIAATVILAGVIAYGVAATRNRLLVVKRIR